MQQHTPGPWEVQQPGTNTFSVAAENKTYLICIVYKYPFVDTEAMANANLIAAAPELLDAAINLYLNASDQDEVIDHNNVGEGEVLFSDWAALKQAINKAIGATA